MKKYKVELSATEIGDLLTLIDVNKREGIYWGCKRHYENRQARIIKELEKHLEEQC